MRSILVFVLGSVFLSIGPSVVQAQIDTEVQKKQPRDVESGAPREQTYRRLERIYEDISEDRFAEARDGLESLLERVEGYDFEEAQIHQALGQTNMLLENLDEAATHIEQAVKLDKLPNRVHYDLLMSLARLKYAQEDFDSALSYLREYVSYPQEDGINSTAFVVAADIYRQRDQFDKAIANIKRAIELSESPKESWYQLLIGLYMEKEQYSLAAEQLEFMIRNFPDEGKYWVQLSQVYLQLERNDRALGVMALAERQGYLSKETHFKQLSNLYSMLDDPFRAARTLEAALKAGTVEETRKSWEQLGNMWYTARELDNALVAFEEAGSRADDGNLDRQRSYILLEKERYQEAIAAAERAIRKGGFDEDDVGNTYVIIGTAAFEMEDYERARTAFRNARDYEKTRRAAGEWLNHISEIQRQQSEGAG